MKICVEIEMDSDTGEYTVTECPAKEEAMPNEEGNEPSGQSFKSLPEAMMAIKSILAGTTAQTPSEAKQSFMTGYGRAGNRSTMRGGM